MVAFNSVAELKPFKFMWKIQVKIIRLWKQYSAGGGLTIEMVSVDMSGDKIHATVKLELTSQWSYSCCGGVATNWRTRTWRDLFLSDYQDGVLFGFKSVSSPTITIVLTANRFSFTRGFYVNTFLTNGLGNLRSISDNMAHWPVSITFVGLYCYLQSCVIPYLCMGSFNRFRSAHQADIKGTGILYEGDDEPIKLVDRDDSFVIKEFGLSLIGKVLNPKKQNVEKLLQTMPSQWGLSERITANDLGNEKFLLNFMSEEDLKSVLRRGPFHYNFCMFVLVRWEPIVHDDYPWIIPFWVQLIGFPLHLWTDTNLRNIGGRLGHVDTLELTEGRMLIEVDSRRPLKFSRKVEYEGDEVTIEIKYKHTEIVMEWASSQNRL
uniref:Uncharacterized protein n=1 Tax=Brassica oleracea var. oleracea TaxID=109376 RepID=A0A0D3ADI5_BRAOL